MAAVVRSDEGYEGCVSKYSHKAQIQLIPFRPRRFIKHPPYPHHLLNQLKSSEIVAICQSVK